MDVKLKRDTPPARRAAATTVRKSTGVVGRSSKNALIQAAARAAGLEPAERLVQVSRRQQAAAKRLERVARRAPEFDRFVTAVLEAAADAVESRIAHGELPETEKQLWEQAGARFDDLDAPARATGRSASALAELRGHSDLGDKQVAARLGVHPTRVSQRVSERSLYAISAGDQRYFPRWQFDGHTTIHGLRDVLTALDRSLHPLTVDHWITTPNADLAVNDEVLSPVEWLRTGGEVDRVVELANAL